MGDENISKDRLHYIDTQKLDMRGLKIKGGILDIGGGGEGIIGQLFNEQVVAIDPIRRELEEAPEGPLKIVMDARDLKFLDYSFDNATSFFTFMYIPLSDHEQVLKEIFRVLKREGEFHIWDVVIPEFDGSQKDIYVVPLEVKLKGKTVETGYGTRWEGRTQDAAHYIDLCQRVGFELVESNTEGESFYLRLRKRQ